jgi:two-component system, chemotaxis family, protein-glutamate methylesterase/glutaminase
MPLPSETTPIRVLVVDDSAFMRFTISKSLNETPGMMVVGTARDGQEALELIPKLQPDVVTLDVEMPRLDGLSTLKVIMANYPRPVVMLSSLTSDGTLETVQALTLGAVDFIAKPVNKANMESILKDVAVKIQRASQAKVWSSAKFRPNLNVATASHTGKKNIRPLNDHDKIVVIGASTGGPRALNSLIPMLTQDLQAAVFIIQHMPAGFTRSLADRLNNISSITVKEAAPGDTPQVGLALLAPGGFHMVLDAEGKVVLNQNPPVHGVRPAVDVTMASIAQRYGKRTVGVILTGMGTDGTTGSTIVHTGGGWVIAEAEETCVVWGMPRSVVEAGMADEVIPLPEIASHINKAVRG